jgi:hypothetical protein
MAGGVRSTRDDEITPGDALGLTDRPLVVFVPGHGSGMDCFDDLAGLMELSPGDYRVFDYRWVEETPDPAHASQTADIDSAADALNAYVAGLAVDQEVYLVGFSKGGATIAEMLSRWDDGVPAPVEEVTGAALLEPPISGGLHGTIQSLGRFVGPIPDDGGYSPVDCDWFGLRCTDNREHLGEAAGVEVVVLRNPNAGITTFDDRPEGLRVYDVPDDGRGPLESLLHNPLTYPVRMAEAHEAVLHDPRVAECILAEMASPGSCDIPAVRSPLARCGGSGGGGAVLMAD